jgi:hypothetical protein
VSSYTYTVVIRKCPHCNDFLHDVDKAEVRSPFYPCPGCSRTVLIPHWVEWACLTPGDRFRFLFFRLLPYLLLGLLAGVVVALILLGWGHDLVGEALLLIDVPLVGGLVAGWLSLRRRRRLREQIRASDERLRDPGYRARLFEAGFRVPEAQALADDPAARARRRRTGGGWALLAAVLLLPAIAFQAFDRYRYEREDSLKWIREWKASGTAVHDQSEAAEWAAHRVKHDASLWVTLAAALALGAQGAWALRRPRDSQEVVGAGTASASPARV